MRQVDMYVALGFRVRPRRVDAVDVGVVLKRRGDKVANAPPTRSSIALPKAVGLCRIIELLFCDS